MTRGDLWTPPASVEGFAHEEVAADPVVSAPSGQCSQTGCSAVGRGADEDAGQCSPQTTGYFPLWETDVPSTLWESGPTKRVGGGAGRKGAPPKGLDTRVQAQGPPNLDSEARAAFQQGGDRVWPQCLQQDRRLTSDLEGGFSEPMKTRGEQRPCSPRRCHRALGGHRGGWLGG